MNVESFNLDHRAVAAPYIRLASEKQLDGGSTITKWDIRFKQPNAEALEMPALHSLEHLFAELSRNHSDKVIDFGPMGCQTGFYLTLDGAPQWSEVAELVEQTLTDVMSAEAVPAANIEQCGWAASHSLVDAQREAAAFLAAREAWEQVWA
ncbi:S-ribosylhomocysteine lyase [Naumannella halotolerans]|uniref:S-ribosylhomocysteine lyase n=1 Tax=Naumannella halotolerans TaxID=993414 RepID=A0A4R7J539_9ACTN|nr:S-ribosylhomocysteine lyase [Naumannella halotolerans]TDT32450.1 S-ribosylhomocysteine lyase [Naumannella halotolerans]